MEFKNNVAFVTGGTRGIGRAIALELANHGCHIAFNYRSSETQAQTLVSEIKKKGCEAYGYRTDISDLDTVKKMIKAVKEELGSIDYLVNNAGITRDIPLMMMKEKDWDEVISTNLKGVFNCTRAAIVGMMKKKKGRILNITSVSGIRGQRGQVNYSSAKAGVIGFTKSLAKEIAALNMTVNALALGFIETDMTSAFSKEQHQSLLDIIPLSRFGTPEEVAKLAVFLLSDQASYMTGQVITLDGGLSI